MFIIKSFIAINIGKVAHIFFSILYVRENHAYMDNEIYFFSDPTTLQIVNDNKCHVAKIKKK